MIYGLNTRLPLENAGAEDVARSGFAAWRKLDDQSRLRLVERRLRPANDFIDGYPPAL